MIRDHKGKEWKSIPDMCKSYNIPYDIFKDRRYRQKWSLEKCLETPVAVMDHERNTFYSITEMCIFYNIPVHIYYHRLANNMTLKEALTTPYKTRIVTDPNGRKFYNVTEMCIDAGIGLSAFTNRLKRGWSFAKALYTPVKDMKPRKIWEDHKGNKYTSFEKMCLEYGKSSQTVHYRLKKLNWSLKDALETPVAAGFGKEFLEKYPDKSDKLPIVYSKYYLIDQRLKDNWDLYDAAMVGNKGKKSYDSIEEDGTYVCIDHEGQKFESLKEMCAHWGVTTATYTFRRKNGLSIKDSLTLPSRYDHYIVDHEGKVYRSSSALYAAYGICRSIFKHREEKGWTLKQILLTPKGQRKPIEDNESEDNKNVQGS